MVESPWLTPVEAAAYTKLSVRYLRELAQEGRLVPGGPDRRPRYHISDLDRFLRGEIRAKRGGTR